MSRKKQLQIQLGANMGSTGQLCLKNCKQEESYVWPCFTYVRPSDKVWLVGTVCLSYSFMYNLRHTQTIPPRLRRQAWCQITNQTMPHQHHRSKNWPASSLVGYLIISQT